MAVQTQNGRSTCIHVIHSLEYGGAQKDLYYYAKFHDRSRYDLEAVSFYPGGEMLPALEDLGIKVHILGTRSANLRSISRLRKIFSERKTSVVHFHNALPVYTGVPAAIFARVPAKVMTEHSISHPGKTGGRFNASIYRVLRRRLDTVIACSQQVRESHRLGLDPGRLITVLNGVDLDHFDISSIGKRTDPGVFHIGTIGSLTPQKGYSILLQSVKILAERGVPVRLTFIGDGPLREALGKEAIESGINDRVVFAGTTGDVMTVLPKFDVVAGSSLREGLPLSILEAMAAGRPVVTTDVGGNREAVIDGITGTLVPPDDPSAHADALEDLWKDAGKRGTMGRMGRARVEEHFSARKMVSDTEKIYESILQSKTGSPQDG